jgi:hypothetical protein
MRLSKIYITGSCGKSTNAFKIAKMYLPRVDELIICSCTLKNDDKMRYLYRSLIEVDNVTVPIVYLKTLEELYWKFRDNLIPRKKDVCIVIDGVPGDVDFSKMHIHGGLNSVAIITSQQDPWSEKIEKKKEAAIKEKLKDESDMLDYLGL